LFVYLYICIVVDIYYLEVLISLISRGTLDSYNNL